MKNLVSILLGFVGENKRQITSLGLSLALMHLLKNNEIMQFFILSNGIHVLKALLKKEKDDKQVCYNLLSCLWIISFKSFTRQHFQNRDNEFIESIIKILQLHGNEKIVRMILFTLKVN